MVAVDGCDGAEVSWPIIEVFVADMLAWNDKIM